MFAYFIGGPWDLTKKAIKSADVKPYYVPEVPRLTDMKAVPAIAPIKTIRHEYRRMWADGDYIIYVYEGIR